VNLSILAGGSSSNLLGGSPNLNLNLNAEGDPPDLDLVGGSAGLNPMGGKGRGGGTAWQSLITRPPHSCETPSRGAELMSQEFVRLCREEPGRVRLLASLNIV
jgi:hypothetical protein